MAYRRPLPIFTFLLVVTCAAIGLLASLPFSAFALLFIKSFELSNPGHLFAIFYSTTIPLFTVCGYLAYTFYRTPLTAILSVIISLAAIGTYQICSHPLFGWLSH